MPFIASNGCNLTNLIGYSVVPGQTEHSLTLGGMGLHINAQLAPERVQLAQEFLEWFAAQKQQREWIKLGGYSARKSVLASGTFVNSAPYAPVLAVSYPLVKDFWNIPEYGQLLNVQMKYLGLAINGSITSTEALVRTAQEQQAILDFFYPEGPPLPHNMKQIEPDEGVVIALLVLVGISILVYIAFGAWVIKYRDLQIYRMSSPTFLVLILVGAIVEMGGLLTYSVLTPTESSCNFHLWLTTLGIIFMFAPLLAKTWRLFRIFHQAKTFQAVSITNAMVFGWVVVVATPVIILLIVWTSINTNGPERDNNLPDRTYTITCGNPNLEIYLGILFGYLGFLGIAAAITSFLVRKISSTFSEAKYLALIIYNSILIGAVILPLIFYLSDDPTARVALEVGGLLFFTASFIGLLFGPKFLCQIHGKGDSVNTEGSIRNKTTATGSVH